MQNARTGLRDLHSREYEGSAIRILRFETQFLIALFMRKICRYNIIQCHVYVLCIVVVYALINGDVMVLRYEIVIYYCSFRLNFFIVVLWFSKTRQTYIKFNNFQIKVTTNQIVHVIKLILFI